MTSNKPKVLFAAIHFNYLQAGAEYYIVNLIRELRNNITSTILCGIDRQIRINRISGNYDIDSVSFFYKLRIYGEKGNTIVHKIVRIVHLAIYIINTIRYLFFHLGDYDFINSHDIGSATAAVIVKLLKRIKSRTVITFHGRIGKFERFIADYCDGVICVNDEIFGQLNPKAKLKATIIYPGFNQDIFYPRSKRLSRKILKIDSQIKMILFIGRLIPVKNIENLLKAMKNVVEKEKLTHLYILGEGVLESDLKLLVTKLGIDKNVRFKGNIEHQLLPIWYSACDTFILPSWSEAFSTVVLEALACKSSVILSREAKSSVKAFLKFISIINPFDIENISKELLFNLRKKFKYNPIIQTTIYKYSSHVLAAKTLKYYLRLLWI